MKKLSNISESTWGNMIKRAEGEQIRREDDVNLMDLDGLHEYIKKKYGPSIEDVDTKIFPGLQQELWTDMTPTISLFTRHKKDGTLDFVLLSWFRSKIAGRFFFRLKERFNVESPNPFRRIITEKDGTCTYKTYLDVLDLFMEDKDGNILEESTWGDMVRRAEGEAIREEDLRNSNVMELKPVDLGLSVLWADQDLMMDDEMEFLIDDVKDYHPLGWRLPTKKEADELLSDAKWTSGGHQGLYDLKYITIGHNGKELKFIYRDNPHLNYFVQKDKSTGEEYWDIFTFHKEHEFYPHSAYSITRISDECRIRFVKDK